MIDASLIISDIKQLLTIPFSPEKSTIATQIGLIENAALAICGGKIVWTGEQKDLWESVALTKDGREISAKGKVVCPCFIDAHTHISGYPYGRANDFEYRTFKDEDYAGIARKGGGIYTTIENTQSTSDDKLYAFSRHILNEFLRRGVGTVEAKSGYGLRKEHEIRQINVLQKLEKEHAVTVVPTYLVHVPDKNMTRSEYINYVQQEILPEAADKVTFIDVFCDQIAFSVAETKQIVESAVQKSLLVSIHVDQTSPFQGAESLAPLAKSLSHLEHISEEGINAMKKHNTIAILFPVCSLHLEAPYPQAKKLLENNIRIALSTDWNPGSSPCSDILFVGYAAAKYLKMPLAEIIRSITIHPASALALESEIGSLEIGKRADFNIIDIEDWRDLFTQCGNAPSLQVYKSGNQVYNSMF